MPNASELRELDDEELENRLSEYRREMLNLRFQLATGQLDNIVRLSVVRKDVARVLTILRDREIALAEGRDAGPVISTRPARRRPVEDVEVAADDDEAAPTRRPRRPRAAAVDEVVDVGDEDEVVPDDADGDEEDQ
jgi:large subunit ribosomal protein L29